MRGAGPLRAARRGTARGMRRCSGCWESRNCAAPDERRRRRRLRRGRQVAARAYGPTLFLVSVRKRNWSRVEERAEAASIRRRNPSHREWTEARSSIANAVLRAAPESRHRPQGTRAQGRRDRHGGLRAAVRPQAGTGRPQGAEGSPDPQGRLNIRVAAPGGQGRRNLRNVKIPPTTLPLSPPPHPTCPMAAVAAACCRGSRRLPSGGRPVAQAGSCPRGQAGRWIFAADAGRADCRGAACAAYALTRYTSS